MKLDEVTRAEIAIAMRTCQKREIRIRNVTILVDEGDGPWGQAMICGAAVTTPHMMSRKWCRSIDELQEFLEGV